MINVLHVIDTGGPGGAETVFLHTATGLDPARFRAVCAVSRDGWLAEQLRARGHSPLIESASGSFNIRYLRRLVRIIRDQRIDVVAAHLYGSAIYGGLASLITGVPVIPILHGQSDIFNAGRFASLKRAIVRRLSQRLVFVSGKLQAELAAALNVPDEKCVIIPNGVDVGRFKRGRRDTLRNELGLPADAILVGAVGNIRVPKAYEVLLRAAHTLRSRSPRYRFVVVGEGSGALYQRLLQLRSELGLDEALSFLGLRTDVADLLPEFDVYALSSTTEGFSIACIEAMACGVPVVATRSGGPEEIIEQGRSGLLVPVNDSAALADSIHRIAMDPQLSDQLAEHGLARVHARFTLSAMLKSYATLFQQVACNDLRSRVADTTTGK